MEILFANLAQSTLAGSITDSAVTANLQAGGGAQFPDPTVNEQYFVGTFQDAATGLLSEIVWCTQRVGDTITIVRAQEGTTALAWAANDLFAELWTKGQCEAMVQTAQAQAQPWNWAADSGSPNVYACSLTPPLAEHIPGMPIRLLVGNDNTGASTFNPGPGAVAMVRRDGSALIGNEMVAGSYAELIFEEGIGKYILSGVAPATDDAITAGTDEQSAVTPAQLATAVGSHDFLADYLGADVPMPTAGTFYDGPELSLTEGTWLVTGVLMYADPTAGERNVLWKVWDGAAAIYGTGGAANLGGVAPDGDGCYAIPFTAKVVLAGPTDVKISVKNAVGSGTTTAYLVFNKNGASKDSVMLAYEV